MVFLWRAQSLRNPAAATCADKSNCTPRVSIALKTPEIVGGRTVARSILHQDELFIDDKPIRSHKCCTRALLLVIVV